ncbi:hypothetical protein RHSIM_Rhsim01G0093600 [Rhododendron simsii]|uniref:PDZ domain-containing protein n=1 Tax=Rhododendron simsii TaxID=118357 RepID=A0A834M1W0_RHOSS|nr:hypothetical protein RHSIM_Rhsim01G0093600 [Rhododendron simsii]
MNAQLRGILSGRSVTHMYMLNMVLDIPTEFKGAIVEAAAAVVSLESYHSGPSGETMFVGSGTIIGCEDVNETYTSTILTSATLLRSSTESNAIQDDIEVNVYLADGKSFKGHLSARDLHFNIATLSITSDVALPTARLRPLDDSISIDPSEILCPRETEVASRSFQLHRHSDSFKICPGDMVVALGRDCCGTHELWAALGKLRQCCRPWSGMELTNLYAAHIGKLEKVISRFNISKGVLVEEVIKGSPAKQAGILQGDVIVQCGKKSVHGFLEMLYNGGCRCNHLLCANPGAQVRISQLTFNYDLSQLHGHRLEETLPTRWRRPFFDVIWENVGKSIEVVVVRESSAAHLNLKLFVDETSPDKVNISLDVVHLAYFRPLDVVHLAVHVYYYRLRGSPMGGIKYARKRVDCHRQPERDPFVRPIISVTDKVCSKQGFVDSNQQYGTVRASHGAPVFDSSGKVSGLITFTKRFDFALRPEPLKKLVKSCSEKLKAEEEKGWRGQG